MSDTWQKKLRYRGFRMMGWSLPILLISLVAASLIPRRPSQILVEGDLPSQKKRTERFVLPAGVDGDVPVTLELLWTRRPPPGLKVELQISDPEGQDLLQKKIRIKAQRAGAQWQQKMEMRLSGAPIRNFVLSAQSREPVVTHYQLTAFAGSPLLRLLRIGEMLFYPALAFVCLAMVMILFPSFIQS